MTQKLILGIDPINRASQIGVSVNRIATQLSHIPTMKTLTPASLDLLLNLIADSCNWSNTPMLDLSPSEKGNYTDLKKNGLVATYRDEGVDFCTFQFTTGQVVTDGARTFTLSDREEWSEAHAV